GGTSRLAPARSAGPASASATVPTRSARGPGPAGPGPGTLSSPSVRDVYRAPVRVLRGLHERLGERGVRVLGEGDVLEGRAHLDRERGLGDEVAGAGADDVAAEQQV